MNATQKRNIQKKKSSRQKMPVKNAAEKYYIPCKKFKLESKRNDQDKMLPSFFSGIPTKAPRDQQSKELRQPKVESNNGPVFFGDCVFHHPAPHSSMLKSRFTAITTKKSTDSLWDNLYKKEEPIHRIITPQKPIRLLKNPSLVVDSLPHRAPGTRIIGGHLHTRRPTEFGTSESILKGEMIREKLCTIPVDPRKEKAIARRKKRELMEKRRKNLPPEKRAAHFHFPKEFVNVRVVGPPIPESITITQLSTDKEEICKKKKEVTVVVKDCGDQCEKMPKLNRRSVGTQSDFQVGMDEARPGSSGKQFEIGTRYSSLCRKSAHRNLLQKSITVDAAGRVMVTFDADNERSRATQTEETRSWNALDTPGRFQSTRDDQLAGPIRVGSPDAAEDIPGTSKSTSVQRESASVQIEDPERSWAVIFSCDEAQSFGSRISELPHIFEVQRPPRRQSDEAVLLVQDYQSYDVMNATRRQDLVPRRPARRRQQPKRKKHAKKDRSNRPVPIQPDESLTSTFTCRICHEGEDTEQLIRPCLCKGSVGFIHAKCLKIWLEQSNTSRCEICGYPYAIRQTKKYTKFVSATVFLRSVADRRALVYDIISFVAVTPLCIVGIAMCIRASIASTPSMTAPGTNIQMGNVTRAGMIMLTTTIIIAYSVWLYTLISYHFKTWKRWYNSCYDVEVIPVFMTSQERLEALHRIQEETRRRSCRAERRSSAASILQPATVYQSLSDFYQRRFPTEGRVQSLPQ